MRKNIYPKRYERLLLVSMPRITTPVVVGFLIAGILIATAALAGIFFHAKEYALISSGNTIMIRK